MDYTPSTTIPENANPKPTSGFNSANNRTYSKSGSFTPKSVTADSSNSKYKANSAVELPKRDNKYVPTLDSSSGWFRGLADLRKHQWGQTHLWDIKFEPGPEDFSEWFPASSVIETQFDLDTFEGSAAFTNFLLPLKRNSFVLSVNFIDTVFHQVRHWVRDWVAKEIFNDTDLTGFDRKVSTLHEIVKLVHIAKLSPRREQLFINSYYVFPKGSLSYEGNETANPDIGQIEFVVAGRVKPVI